MFDNDIMRTFWSGFLSAAGPCWTLAKADLGEAPLTTNEYGSERVQTRNETKKDSLPPSSKLSNASAILR